MVFHLGVLCQPLLIVIDVIEGSGELVVAQGVARQVFNDDLLQLTQFLIGLAVMLRKGLDVVARGGTSHEEALDIGEHHSFLVLHMLLYLASILVVEL